MDPEEFIRAALAGWPEDVSRETIDRLGRYHALLQRWQARINLVGAATLPFAWRRHFLDSAQLYPLIPETAHVLVDLGSGAGFPGLVLAILLDAARRDVAVHLIESDGRKSAFLTEVVRETGLGPRVQIHVARAESLAKRLPPANLVTARALAPLTKLLGLARPFLAPDGLCLFLKGANADEEIAAAERDWAFQVEARASLTEPGAAVLVVRGISALA